MHSVAESFFKSHVQIFIYRVATKEHKCYEGVTILLLQPCMCGFTNFFKNLKLRTKIREITAYSY